MNDKTREAVEMKESRLKAGLASVAVAAALALGVGPTSVTKDAAAWEPRKPVQFVVMAGKGDGCGCG